MLELGFIGLSIIVIILLVLGYRHILNNSGVEAAIADRKWKIALFAFIAWILYSFGLSLTGILENYELPPRFPIFLIIPAFVILLSFLYRHRNNDAFLEAIPPSWLIYFQSFRIGVESLFIAAVAVGYLHPEVTLEGYNFDMFVGLTAPIVAYLVFNKGVLSLKAALIWNYAGLAILGSVVLLFITTTFIPSLWGSSTSLAPIEMVMFPYNLVAAFLMPVAVFIHLLSILQLRKILAKSNSLESGLV